MVYYIFKVLQHLNIKKDSQKPHTTFVNTIFADAKQFFLETSYNLKN